MKLLNEKAVRFARHAAPALILVSALVSCGSPERLASAPVVPAANGPAADYPVVVGAPYKVGDKLNVEWKGVTYPATVIGVPGANQYKIHYDGYAASWDEVVGPSRIKGRR